MNVKLLTTYKVLVFALVLLLLGCVFLAGCSRSVNAYGKKIEYVDNQIEYLPDFSIQFLGSIGEANCTDYTFVAERESEQTSITWCGDTDNIEPRRFEIGGNEYVLEVGSTFVEQPTDAEKMRWSEMIVWQKEEYERRKKDQRQK